MDGLDDIVREFLVESHENLDQLDSDLVALEEQPGSRPLLSSIFRTIHTIKGTSGFLALSKLERLAHVGENLLVDLRDGTRSMDKPVTDVLLAMVDRIRMLLGAIEATGTEGDVAIDDVVARVEAVHAGVPLEAPAPEPASQEATTQDEVEQVDDEHVQQVEAPAELVAAAAGAAAPAPAAPAAPPAPAPAAPAAPAAPEATVPAQHPAPAAERVEEHPPTEELGALRGVGDSAIRVDVDLLDALMRQVGELVLARNQISRLASATAQVDLVRSAQRLNLIAGELQEGVMKTRMQPIDNVFAKMPRIVRDLATACGREVALEVSGGDTELDRGLLEAVKDPLTHLVRNAVDHGIEPSAERVAAGKSPKGLLALRAYHAGGQVVVEVSDDGRGVDTVKVAAKAVERGLRTQAQVDTASTADLLQLLFLPGFSTAATVTNVSGRGVGMDVVRTKVENVGGTVDVESTPGKGTVWRLRIPLTLAIMPALTVECRDDVYAVPQVNLLELVALDAQRGRSAIEYVHAAPVYRLRGDLLPLVSLAEVLGVAEGRDGSVVATDGDTSSVIAVVQADHHRFGLLVDRVLNTEEIVVKPLSPRLKAIGTYAGATVLGDGRVSLILDVQALGRRALIGELDAMARKDVGGFDTAHSGAAEQVLVVGIGGGRRVAMPLQSVTRLEQVRLDQVEHVGGREVVRYRGTILPLARLDRVLGSYGEAMDEELVVVVLTRRGRSVGLVVHEIVDILEDHSEQHSDIDDSGLVGSTVLGERVTERLDVRTAILAADPVFFDDRPEAGTAPDAAWSGIDDLVGAGR